MIRSYGPFQAEEMSKREKIALKLKENQHIPVFFNDGKEKTKSVSLLTSQLLGNWSQVLANACVSFMNEHQHE